MVPLADPLNPVAGAAGSDPEAPSLSTKGPTHAAEKNAPSRPPIALVTLTISPLGLTSGQTTKSASRRTYPSLPGAVESPPVWLAADKEVPFDLKAYFTLPPASQNAAPLYLDALFEFDEKVSSCFPPGPQTNARIQKVRNRDQRAQPLYSALGPNSSTIDRSAIRELLPEYQEGFRKLKRAQAQPRLRLHDGHWHRLIVAPYSIREERGSRRFAGGLARP